MPDCPTRYTEKLAQYGIVFISIEEFGTAFVR